MSIAEASFDKKITVSVSIIESLIALTVCASSFLQYKNGIGSLSGYSRLYGLCDSTDGNGWHVTEYTGWCTAFLSNVRDSPRRVTKSSDPNRRTLERSDRMPYAADDDELESASRPSLRYN